MRRGLRIGNGINLGWIDLVPRRGGGAPDTTPPTVTITSTESSPSASATIPITITFSEPVTGFTVGDITAADCTLSDFAGSGTTYLVTANPTGIFVTLDIAQNVCVDGAGNGNVAASQFSIKSLVGLVAYWRMDEVQDTNPPAVTRADSSGRGNNLTEEYSVAPLASVNGKVGLAAHVNDGDGFTKASNADMRTGDIDFELALWVYIPTSIPAGKFFFAKTTTQYTNLEYAFRTNGSKFDFLVRNAANTNYGNVTDTTVLSADTWYFVDMYHDSVNNQMGISVNGAAFVTASYSAGVYDSTAAFGVGRNTGDPVACYIDEFGFWKRILSASERTALFNGGTGQYPF